MKKPPSKNIISITDIKEQLKNYPTPVSDCDEQFNFLLSERDRLQKEITKDQSLYKFTTNHKKSLFNPFGVP